MKSNYQIALEILAGKWGNGAERREAITSAGYDYNAVQSIVNALVSDGYIPPEDKGETVTVSNTLTVDFDTSKYDSLLINFIK